MQNTAIEIDTQHWSAERYHELERQLSSLDNADNTELVNTRNKLTYIRSALFELRQQVIDQGFESREEEIWFMKKMLPLFLSWQYLYGEWLQVLSQLPKGNPRIILQHYLGFLKQVNHFAYIHYPFYHYYQLELTESDQLYFVRGVSAESTVYLPLADPLFSTAMANLFAQFMAFDTLRGWLLERIREMGGYPVLDTWQDPFAARRLQWTGSQVNLVELIYGLYHTGQLNDGQATLGDILRLMEDIFQIELTGLHRSFHDIRNRKRLTPTNFLDEMRKCIMDMVDRDLAYDPSKKSMPERSYKLN